MTTPFDYKGQIYWAKLDHNVATLLRTKLTGLMFGDRWSEGPLLTSKERVAIWSRVAKRCGDKVQLLAVISGSGVSEARDLLQQAQDCGCTAAVLEAPCLKELNPGAQTWELFFRSVADAAEIPVLVNVRMGDGPGSIGPSDLRSLAAHPRIDGALIEGATGDNLAAAAAACGTRFWLLVRDLEGMVPSLAGGACAAVPSIASIVPFFALSIEEAVRTRETGAAAELAVRGASLDCLLQRHGVPAMKCALDLRGYFGGAPRLPLTGLDATAQEDVARALHGLAS